MRGKVPELDSWCSLPVFLSLSHTHVHTTHIQHTHALCLAHADVMKIHLHFPNSSGRKGGSRPCLAGRELGRNGRAWAQGTSRVCCMYSRDVRFH